MTDHDTTTAIHWPDMDYPDPRDIDEAVERGIEIDPRYDRLSPGCYVTTLDLSEADAARLGIEATVGLSVTPSSVTLLYGPAEDPNRVLAWEPAEDEAQVLAYRQALTNPEGEALDLAEQAIRRDTEAAAEAA
ncbi:hypothetical protein [Lichenibacterium ramalinae]|uniref:Uncharacterized protein n=1 Tax=Lichenibacterium ramalinae TaxID=2316527 RepID=A0A4Q2R9G4_9HYPH|nr:hypothetical protein [Lichenibacterium ramalinae]RYB03575.1 hypothetical protein D3272_15585 [Lichenibacterium ramalinae]